VLTAAKAGSGAAKASGGQPKSAVKALHLIGRLDAALAWQGDQALRVEHFNSPRTKASRREAFWLG
jgi:hypothetical protein